ncbi:hypothetical protein KBI23_16340 [bacterium]|nr:hypothetical protein [bacterium]MBP9806804.1 hypothetical protein [bacterium]
MTVQSPQRFKSALSVILAILLWNPDVAQAAEEQTPMEMPDINQLDAGVNGRMDCGPAAAANYLYWLSSHGYPAVVKKGQDSKSKILLELEQLMQADSTGTGVANFSGGLSAFLYSKGYKIRSLECLGWRRGANQIPPNLNTLKKTIDQGGGVFLNFGWYRTGTGDRYLRTGGHWVTLAGFAIDEQNPGSSNVFVVYDPSPRSGSQPKRETFQLTGLTSGTLITNKNEVTLPAKHYLHYTKLQNTWKIPASADVAILDAAVCVLPEKL